MDVSAVGLTIIRKIRNLGQAGPGKGTQEARLSFAFEGLPLADDKTVQTNQPCGPSWL